MTSARILRHLAQSLSLLRQAVALPPDPGQAAASQDDPPAVVLAPALEIAPAPARAPLGVRPRHGAIDPRSAWVVQAGARPLLGQLVHQRLPDGGCRLVVVTRLNGDSPRDDATVMLADPGVGGRTAGPWAFHHNPREPRRETADWHRVSEHDGAPVLREPFEDPYAEWATRASCRPVPGQVVHIFDPANDLCVPAFVDAACGDGGSFDPTISLVAAGAHGLARRYRHALPVASPVSRRDAYGPSWHRVGECARGR